MQIKDASSTQADFRELMIRYGLHGEMTSDIMQQIHNAAGSDLFGTMDYTWKAGYLAGWRAGIRHASKRKSS